MKMSQLANQNADTLPKQFVAAMRTLFDIMDDKKTGYVRFLDIENRWRDDGTKGLPKGVIESLQKVTPPDGLLTFDRFCAGLKICLLRNKVDSTRRQNQIDQHPVKLSSMNVCQTSAQIHRPPSAPLLDMDEPQMQKSNWNTDSNAMHHITANAQHRTLSMPQLVPGKDQAIDPNFRFSGEIPHKLPPVVVYGPPKPPRVAANLEKNPADIPEMLPNLAQWKSKYGAHIDVDGKEDIITKYTEDTMNYLSRDGRGNGDGKPANEQQIGMYQKKTNVRRREPRRHTLQNGIDYNMLKRMKQIEQEKDILVQGLSAIEQTREWYLKQLAEVQEKMRYTTRMGTHVEPWSEAQQERLELQRARVMELNRQLAALAGGGRRGLAHIDLALAPATALHRHNHMLTEEVNKKSERIAILEREKSSLIRELLQLTNRNKNPDVF